MYIRGTDLKRRSGDISNINSYTLRYLRSVNGAPPTDNGPCYCTSAHSHGDFVGYDNPNYHERVKRGELLPFTPWRRFYWNMTGVKGVYDYTVTGNIRNYVSVPGAWYEKSGWQITDTGLEQQVASDYNYLVTNAAAKTYGKGFDALTWLAELKDVKRLWRSISDKLLHLKLPKGFSGMTSQWLEYRYGWRQLVNDFNNLNEAIRHAKLQKNRFSERSGLLQTWQTSTVTNETWYYLNVTKTVTDKYTLSARGSVVADIEIPAFQFNLLQTGWEVITLSFVVDWFVNVGKTLAAINFLVNARRYAACWGYKLRLDRDWHLVSVSGRNGYVSGSVEQQMVGYGELESRHPCQVPYFPHLVLRMDTFKVFDLIGLISQRLK